MAYAASEVAHILGLPEPPNPTLLISQLAYDSRRIGNPSEALFFAIRGQQHDGHAYVDQAYDKGVRNFVVEGGTGFEYRPEANYFEVPNSVAALQQIAAHHRKRFHIPVLAITGSNGKTTVKEWFHQILSPDLQVVRSPNSFNSQIGVPLSVWDMKPGHELAIFEAGISQPGEMEKLQQVIQPTWGLITNLGPAHDEGFAERGQKLREKLQIFREVEVLFYCRDQAEVKAGIKKHLPGIKTFSWGEDEAADVVIHRNPADGTTVLTVQHETTNGQVRIPFSDAVGIENCCHLLCVWIWLKKPLDQFETRVQTLQRVALRLEMKAARDGGLLIYDCYNADLRSLEVALDFLDVQSRGMPKAAILSDFLETGMQPENLYKQIARLLAGQGIERVYGIGSKVVLLQQFLPDSVEFQSVPSTEAFLQKEDGSGWGSYAILLKGARAFRVERIGQILEQRVHGTVFEINLSHLVHNLRTFRQVLIPGVKVMAMVKAFSYGSGTFEIANLLQFHQVDYLAVAYTDEGVHLRDKQIGLPIMIMNPEPDQMPVCRRHGLEPEVYSWETLQAAMDSTGDGKLTIHLKVDTGMHRLGFAVQDAQRVAQKIMSGSGIQVGSVFTHLSAAEDPQHDGFTEEQVQHFQAFYEQLAEGLGYRPLMHVLNSGGISRLSKYQMDMVRLGIGMYGVDPSGALQDQLKPIGRLITTVSQVHRVEAGESVGYGRAERVDTPKKIATVAIGYADGYGRVYSQGKGAMWINGHLAPVVGNVCMDMTMIDVTEVGEVQVGDEVEIFGPHLSIQQVAEQAGTIPYEILSSVSQRVKRVYVED